MEPGRVIMSFILQSLPFYFCLWLLVTSTADPLIQHDIMHQTSRPNHLQLPSHVDLSVFTYLPTVPRHCVWSVSELMLQQETNSVNNLTYNPTSLSASFIFNSAYSMSLTHFYMNRAALAKCEEAYCSCRLPAAACSE